MSQGFLKESPKAILSVKKCSIRLGDFMSSKQLLSVVVPVYNAEKYIERCLCSIVEQTYSNLEIIVVDDCSVDRTRDICAAFAEKDSRIKFVRLQENIGPGGARNIGLSQASGELVTFVDSDDWIDTDTYELCLSELNNGEYDIVQFGHYESKDRYGGRERIVCSSSEALERLVNHKDIVTWSVWNKVFSAEVIKGIKYDTDIYCGEDVLYIQKALKMAKKLLILNVRKYHYLNENEKRVSKSARNFYDSPEFRRRFAEEYRETGGRPYELACAEYFALLLQVYLEAGVNSDLQRKEKLGKELKSRKNQILSNKLLPLGERLKYRMFYLLGSRMSFIFRRIKVRVNGRCRKKACN